MLSDDGTSIADDAKATEAIRSHWEPVFTQGSHDADVVAQLRNYVARLDDADLLDYTADD